MTKQRILEIWQAAIDAGHSEWVLLPYGQPEAMAAMKDRFFNGVPCNRGHVATRIAPSGHCTVCERGYSRHYVGLRRSTKARATPAWLTEDNHATIRTLHDEAARLTNETGVAHHVDHIVPLKHASVCGLHVPWNLQVLSGSENSAKSNRFDGTMENEGWRAAVTQQPEVAKRASA